MNNMSDKALVSLENNLGLKLDITKSPLACDVYDFDGNLLSTKPISIEQKNISSNGTYTAPTGKAYSPVVVNVPQITTKTLNVTNNGTYTAPSGQAYKTVNVNVSGSSMEYCNVTFINADESMWGPDGPVVALSDDNSSLIGQYFSSGFKLDYDETLQLKLPYFEDNGTYSIDIFCGYGVSSLDVLSHVNCSATFDNNTITITKTSSGSSSCQILFTS